MDVGERAEWERMKRRDQRASTRRARQETDQTGSRVVLPEVQAPRDKLAAAAVIGALLLAILVAVIVEETRPEPLTLGEIEAGLRSELEEQPRRRDHYGRGVLCLGLQVHRQIGAWL